MSTTLEMPAAKLNKPKSKFSKFLFFLLLILLIAFVAWLYSGRIVSKNSELSAGFISITAPISSTVSAVLVEPNAHVQAGQLLAKLDVGDYLHQLTAAKDLVRGTIYSAQNTEARVAEAQKAAEEMVKRIALARHEEGIRKNQVETSSIEHAKAQLNMRNVEAKGGTAAQKESARKAELIASQKLESAKASFEFASQSRTAIEAELHKIRDSKMAAKQDISMKTFDPSQIYAPINGYLTKYIPLNGQALSLDETIFQIIPETGANIYALARLAGNYTKEIPKNSLCFVKPTSGLSIYEGKVVTTTIEADTTIVNINIHSSKNLDHANISDTARTVFWVHPLADNVVVKYLLMALSYIPLP